MTTQDKNALKAIKENRFDIFIYDKPEMVNGMELSAVAVSLLDFLQGCKLNFLNDPKHPGRLGKCKEIFKENFPKEYEHLKEDIEGETQFKVETKLHGELVQYTLKRKD